MGGVGIDVCGIDLQQVQDLINLMAFAGQYEDH
jgi:hypothetical protein